MGSNSVGNVLKILSFDAVFYDSASTCTTVTLTHGLLAIRGVIDGASYLDVAPQMGLELLIGLIYATLAWLIFRKRIMDTRRTGQMELV